MTEVEAEEEEEELQEVSERSRRRREITLLCLLSRSRDLIDCCIQVAEHQEAEAEEELLLAGAEEQRKVCSLRRSIKVYI